MQGFENVLLDRAFFVIIGAIFGLLAKEGITIVSAKKKTLGIGLSLILLPVIYVLGLPYFERLFNFDLIASIIFISTLLLVAFMLITQPNNQTSEDIEVIENE